MKRRLFIKGMAGLSAVCIIPPIDLGWMRLPEKNMPIQVGNETSMREFLHDFVNDPQRVFYAKAVGLMTAYIRRPGTDWTGSGAQYYYAGYGDKALQGLVPDHFNKITQDLIDLIVKDWVLNLLKL